MSRRQRRQHKKRLARRRKLGKRAAMALAGAAAIAAGTQAYADPIRFDNPPGPGHYDWDWTLGAGHEVLDILSDGSSQPGVLHAPGSFQKGPDPYGAGEGIDGANPSNMLQAQVIAGYSFLAGVDSGELIPTLDAGLVFRGGGYAYTTYYYAYYYAGVRTVLPEGVPTYLGVKFDLGSGDQYGWIGVVRTGQTTDAFAWGYETDPGVPIPAGIPEPGTLGVLALGAAGLAGRRPKRRC